ncbi:MAG: hypothetical protein US85_C0013G0037, partial [Candidatus Shapirobacteria bacterium GW2011_GWF1_38_23]
MLACFVYFIGIYFFLFLPTVFTKNTFGADFFTTGTTEHKWIILL